MTVSKNAMGDAKQWLVAEYEALSENIRQRERFLESTTYYAFTALGTASSFLLYFTWELRGWQPLISFSLALVFLIFFLDVIRQQFEIVWLATVIEHYIHFTIAPFYGGKRLLHWEPFRLAKRVEVLGEKSIFSIILSSIIPTRVTARRIIELKPACMLVLLLSLAFSAFGCWSWVRAWYYGSMCPLQHALAALLLVAYTSGVIDASAAGRELLKQSKQTVKDVEPDAIYQNSAKVGQVVGNVVDDNDSIVFECLADTENLDRTQPFQYRRQTLSIRSIEAITGLWSILNAETGETETFHNVLQGVVCERKP